MSLEEKWVLRDNHRVIPAPGTTLLHYRLVEPIGQGGMGVVWRALDTTLSRDVAIKVLPDLFAGDPERLARFNREAKLLASLSHPNIAAIYGLHDAEGLRFLVMELVRGRGSRRADRAGADAGRRVDRDRAAHRRGARGGARERRHPPRPEARERPPRRRRDGQDPRLRPRQGVRPRPGLGLVESDDDADGDFRRLGSGADPRDGGLHVPRAGARQAGRPPRGHLVVRMRPLRDAHREAAVRRRDGLGFDR